MKVYTQLQMRRIEEKTVLDGISYSRIMENAGAACTKAIKEKYSLTKNCEKKIVVVCGKGNNGGDGFVIARKLFEFGSDVTVVLACGEPETKQAMENFNKLKDFAMNIYNFETMAKSSSNAIENADIIIDAVFGIALNKEITGKLVLLIKIINGSNASIVSIDVPSGVLCDTAEVFGECIKADFTIGICVAKPCHVLYPGKSFCGEVKIVAIGISEEEIKSQGDGVFITPRKQDIIKCFKPRNPISNKGDYGKVLIVAGSRNMPGAAVLAAQGAVRGGAGLVTVAFPESAYSAITSKLTCPLFFPLQENKEGTLSAESTENIFDLMEKATVVLIGCGLGCNEDTAKIVGEVIKNAKVPIIIDADGINIISANINILKEAKVPIILTPHPGEMSRLTGLSVEQIQSGRIQTAREFALQHNLTLVLKGANTVVAHKADNSVSVNQNGNAGMAKGGSGDLLAGIIASFIAQGMNVKNASICGVYIHALAGDIAKEKYSITAMTPSDMVDCLPIALSIIEK